MAAASLTVMTPRGEIRKYGGNNSHVRSMMQRYLKMSFEDFLKQHPNSNFFEYQNMVLETRFHKN